MPAIQPVGEMERQCTSKAELARRLHTSRSLIDRLPDPECDAVSLATMVRAAKAVGHTLRLELHRRRETTKLRAAD